ncbi:MAG: CpsB/CapC family capsule biosynthesis tyrosine phosphatase [Deltaproteobacteria bacterium]|nr:CpsB/CapC family capsule biosynthesis tyrosine phosphatase [Deltaproteobacteria bacterium]
MSGFIDLHCHPLPAIDDGCRSAHEGAALLCGLASIGFTWVVATPHVRSGMWNNTRTTIAPAHLALEAALEELRARGATLPRWDFAAEHLFDDVSWERMTGEDPLTYPGKAAVLIEFAYERLPERAEVRLWRLSKTFKLRPVIAHPERCATLQAEQERLLDIQGAGCALLLDLMSLVGAYGKRAQASAERWLDESRYTAAASDAHKPEDVSRVAQAIEALGRRVGPEGVTRLLVDGPKSLLGDAAI